VSFDSIVISHEFWLSPTSGICPRSDFNRDIFCDICHSRRRYHVPATLPTVTVATMPAEAGYHNRGTVIGTKIFDLLRSLGPATYDEVSPKIEFWIEWALTELTVNADDLVDQLSSTIWDIRGSDAEVARFLKEFRDAPHRSEQARPFVDNLCPRFLRLFATASAEDLTSWNKYTTYKLAKWGGEGFVRAASLVGHLIECGVLDHELVRQYLIKPLIAHHYTDNGIAHKYFRAGAIYQLFVAAGNTLLQGLLKTEDVQVCFETLDFEVPLQRVVGLDAGKLQVRRPTRSRASHRYLTCSVRDFGRSTPRG